MLHYCQLESARDDNNVGKPEKSLSGMSLTNNMTAFILHILRISVTFYQGFVTQCIVGKLGDLPLSQVRTLD